MTAHPPENENTCCGIRLDIRQRPLLPEHVAGGLESLFKVFANGTRLRILHAIMRAGELCVTDLASAVGMKPQAVSNQLQRLVDRGMVAARRNGINIFYRIIDPCVVSLLDRGCCLLEEAQHRTAEHRPGLQRMNDVATGPLDESNPAI
jgi:ArsR family transcriptional regulator, lead/cadmium/zinc/bismuth-responsive transcriptional repressor